MAQKLRNGKTTKQAEQPQEQPETKPKTRRRLAKYGYLLIGSGNPDGEPFENH